MRFRIEGLASLLTGISPKVQLVPYNVLVALAQQTVGVAATAITLVAARDTLIILRNVSTAGQAVRWGTTGVSFGAPPFGMLLYPGESSGPILPLNSGIALKVIADAAGALVDVIQMQDVA